MQLPSVQGISGFPGMLLNLHVTSASHLNSILLRRINCIHRLTPRRLSPLRKIRNQNVALHHRGIYVKIAQLQPPCNVVTRATRMGLTFPS
jgi:hypothetical protein